jgi:Ino eighty subunit 2
MSDSELSSVELSEGYVSPQEEPYSEDNFIDDDEDFEEEVVKPPKKQRLNLKLKLPKDDSEKPLGKRLRKPSTPVPQKRTSGRTKKNTSYTFDYDDEEFEDEDEDVIPTPALDDEGLSEDEEVDQTPDLTKMTERQRAKLLNEDFPKEESPSLISLSNDIQKRRVLTEEENQLRKAEIARKRKNLTEKKLEEEKQDTINKLLKRRAGKASAAQLEEDEENLNKEKPRRPQLQHPALFSWVSKKDSLALRVPEPLIRGD